MIYYRTDTRFHVIGTKFLFFKMDQWHTRLSPPVPLFLFLPHFDVICDLLLNRRTATWNLFVNFSSRVISVSVSRDWIFPNKTGGISELNSPIFKTALVAKNIWRIINTIASIWRESILAYLSLDVIISAKLETDDVCGQKSKDIFAPNGGYCLHLI